MNRRAVLARCLAALVAQTYRAFEIVVVDDGSTDDTPAWIASFAAANPDLRLRCLANETNLGANRSRNRGIQAAEGSLCAFLDSDCIARPDWIEKLVAGFTSERVAAVTGVVEELPPRNIFELMYRGTSRVYAKTEATRLVAGNMCLRRELLLVHPLDEDLKYGCDEEGIYLRLRAAGYEQRLAPDAVVRHEHPFTGRSLFRQARVGGAAAAWLVYKYHLRSRLDLLPFMLTYLLLPLIAFDRWLGVPAVCCFAAGIAALLYNELFRKGKTLAQTLIVFPVLLVYYHVRLVGYVGAALALRLGLRSVQRVRLKAT